MKTKWAFAAILFVAGCGQAPPPTGPAAEATTPEVEVTIPETSGTADPGKTSLVSFTVPGMT